MFTEVIDKTYFIKLNEMPTSVFNVNQSTDFFL